MIEPTNPLPMLKMVGVFMGATVLLSAASVYLWPDPNLPSLGGIVASSVAALQAGFSGARRTNRQMTQREKLIFAVWATTTSMVAGAAFLWGLFAYYEMPFTMMTFMTVLMGKLPNAAVIKAFPWIFLFAVAVSVLIFYHSVGEGAKMQLKAAERRAAKGK